MGSLTVGLTGGLAKFNFSALRLPVKQTILIQKHLINQKDMRRLTQKGEKDEKKLR